MSRAVRLAHLSSLILKETKGTRLWGGGGEAILVISGYTEEPAVFPDTFT